MKIATYTRHFRQFSLNLASLFFGFYEMLKDLILSAPYKKKLK